MDPKEGRVYTDLKYGSELIVKEVRDTVVLVKELESGNSRLFGREEFSQEKNRLSQKE